MIEAVEGLKAVRLEVDPGPPVDPFALAGADGIVVRSGHRTRVGLGVALTIELPHGLDSADEVRAAAEVLASIPTEDHVGDGVGVDGGTGTGHDPGPGNGILAFGALPFDRSAPATLTVPEVVYGFDDGEEGGPPREWVTLIGTDHLEELAGPGARGVRAWLIDRSGGTRAPDPDPPLPGPGPDRDPVVSPRSSDDSFRAMVAEALHSIDQGDVAKVVVARQVDVTMPAAVDVPDLLRRWNRLEPNCTVFSMPGDDGQFVGASPELLIERSGREIHSRPLAGTTGRSPTRPGGGRTGGLLSSQKDGNEHQLVVRAIEKVLRPLCDELDVPDRPGLVHLHTITHLGTPITGTLSRRRDGTTPTSLDLVAALHPTPAVGGVPRDRARALIGHLEPGPRGRFAGPVGYLDAAGDGEWMLGIRSMTVDGASAALAAGVGIVDGSDPDNELYETNLKLAAVFDALAPGSTLPVEQPAPTRHEAVS